MTTAALINYIDIYNVNTDDYVVTKLLTEENAPILIKDGQSVTFKLVGKKLTAIFSDSKQECLVVEAK